MRWCRELRGGHEVCEGPAEANTHKDGIAPSLSEIVQTDGSHKSEEDNVGEERYDCRFAQGLREVRDNWDERHGEECCEEVLPNISL